MYSYGFDLEPLQGRTYTFKLYLLYETSGMSRVIKVATRPLDRLGWMFKVFGGGLRNGSLFYVSSVGRNSHHEETVPDRLRKEKTECNERGFESAESFSKPTEGVNAEQVGVTG
jgi:hypothetical protein